MKKCYIAGPITGTTDYEQRFADAAKQVVAMNMIPVNPNSLLHNHNHSWQSYLRESLKAMLDCECIYMMTDYEKSKGATLERFIAQRLGYEIFYQ